MALNTIQDGTTLQHWLPSYQRTLDRMMTATTFCDVATSADRIFHAPYDSDPTVTDGVITDNVYAVSQFSVTDDTLTVNRRAVAAEHIDSFEELQARVSLMARRSQRHAYVVSDAIDKFVYSNTIGVAGISTIDNTDLGGGAGDITLSNTNVDDVFNQIHEKIGTVNGAADRGLFASLRPKDITKVRSFRQNNGFGVADAAIRGTDFTNNGVVTQFVDVDVIKTNNLDVTTGTRANALAGVRGSVFLAKPSGGNEFEAKSVTLKHGRELETSSLYNTTVWNNMKPEILHMQLAL